MAERLTVSLLKKEMDERFDKLIRSRISTENLVHREKQKEIDDLKESIKNLKEVVLGNSKFKKGDKVKYYTRSMYAITGGSRSHVCVVVCTSLDVGQIKYELIEIDTGVRLTMEESELSKKGWF